MYMALCYLQIESDRARTGARQTRVPGQPRRLQNRFRQYAHSPPVLLYTKTRRHRHRRSRAILGQHTYQWVAAVVARRCGPPKAIRCGNNANAGTIAFGVECRKTDVRRDNTKERGRGWKWRVHGFNPNECTTRRKTNARDTTLLFFAVAHTQPGCSYFS